MPIPWSRSIYRISIAGTDVSDRVAPYLISVECQDKEGDTSDTCNIVLDDQGGRFLLPQEGDPLTVDLGAIGRGVVRRFTGTVDTVRSRLDRGGGLTLEIHGKGLDNTKGAKQPRQKHKDNATLQDTAGEFAKAAGLSGVEVHPDLASVQRPYWAMDQESFIAWGRRTAMEMGAVFKVVGDKAVFVPKNAGVSASGKPLTTVRAAVGENLISAEIAPTTARPKYQKFRARHYDKAEAKWKVEEVEAELASGNSRSQSGQVDQTVTHSRADGDQAKGAATAESKDADQDKGGGRVEIDGDPTAVAGAICELSGMRDGVDGPYQIETVTDRLDRGRGYVTSLDLVRPGGSQGGNSKSRSSRSSSKG